MPQKRLRIFAGPNGSGKSTIFNAVKKIVRCPYFVNADEIFKSLHEKGILSFDQYMVLATTDHFCEQFQQSGFFARCQYRERILAEIKIQQNQLHLSPHLTDSYFAAFIADFLRNNMLNIVQQFTIETVLSDVRKIEYIRKAKEFGYRIYLYFVATQDATINIARVAQRVQLGGHNVPQEKIIQRYHKSLDNILPLLKLCDRAYFFDNSTEQWVLLAEYEAPVLHIQQEDIPVWFYQHVFKKIQDV